MCGIIGIWKQEQIKIERIVVSNMLDKQKHRGPDNEGIWIDNNKAFGHNRLSIIDLSPKAHQPMISDDGQLIIVFNGEIYNFKEIRKLLIQKGQKFNSESDTEVILYAYRHWGIDFLPMLNGMFAFCIFDKIKNIFVLACDRFGKKPLFYYFDNQIFVFASELKALISYPNLKLVTDFESIDLFLSLQYIPAPKTIYKNIFRLKPSEYLIFNGEQIKTNSYYDIEVKKDLWKLNYEDAKLLVKQKVNEAVTKRMVSDVPLGSFLSGGIDSSIVTAILAQNSANPINTISVGFKEKKYSELDKARSIANKYKTNHNEYILDIEEAKNSVVDIISYYDQPFGDSSAIPTYFLSKVTKKHVTVALSGDGGDELFTGYQRYFLDKKINSVQKIVPNNLLKFLLSFTNFVPPLKNVPIEKNFLLGLKRLNQVIDIDDRASILRWGSYFNFEQKKKLYIDYQLNEDNAVKYLTELFDKRNEISNYTQQTKYADIFSYAHGDYLVKTDIAAMQHSLEVRCPLLDYDLVNTAFSLNPAFFTQGSSGKKILKEAFKNELTNEVLFGAKRGFSIPSAEWFRADWLKILNDYLASENSFCKKYFNHNYINLLINEHLKNNDDHSKRLYLLLVLEVWFQKI